MSEKILVIDDHPETLNVVTFILEQRGYKILSADSGAEGIALAEAEKPDLILLDVMMPGMNGYEVCRHLREQQDFANTPIIMFTAKVQVGDKLAGFEAGADDYLTKPTDPAELARRIRALLSRHEEQPPGDEEIDDSGPVETLPPVSQPRLSGLIALIGARGGAGTTTTAINLAVSMANSGHKTTLVDLDMVQGHISIYLKQKIEGGLNELSRFSGQELIHAAPGYCQPFSDNLHLLLAQSNLAGLHPELSVEQSKDLLQALPQMSNYAVVDLGRGISQEGLPLLKRADHVIICLKPERIAIFAARKLISSLKKYQPHHSTLHTLMLTIGSTPQIPKESIEAFLHQSKLEIMSISRKDMAEATSQGVPLLTVASDPESGKLFNRLCRTVTTPVA